MRDTDELTSMLERAVPLMAANVDDAPAQVEALEGMGFDRAEAHRIAALMPHVFARSVIADIAKIHWHPNVTVLCGGSDKEFPLNAQPEFQWLQSLANVHRRFGVLDNESFVKIAGATAEIDTVSKAMNAGVDLEDGAMATVLHYSPFAAFLLP